MEHPVPAAAGSATQESTDQKALSDLSWNRRDCVFLIIALLAAGWYAFGHLRDPWGDPRFHLPGIGLTLTQGALAAAALGAAKREGRLRVRKNPGGVFLLCIALGLGVCYGLYADDLLRLMNLPVTYVTTALALFSLTGTASFSPWTGPGLLEGVRRFLPAFFRHISLPFRAVKNRLTHRSGRLNGLGAGLLLGVPAVFIALLLLTSADGMFDSVLTNSLRRLGDMDAFLIVRLAVLAAGALCLFSFLFSTARPGPEPTVPNPGKVNAVTYATVLAMLSVLYGLFVYVQFRYLFGGGEIAALKGGYAEYARSGFFQLVLLSLLTLGLILPGLILCRESRAVRGLCAALALLTGVIDYSALFRMRLYIQAYGYSLLRVVTLWGIAMIALALVGVIVKSAKPAIRICPALTALALSTWLILNLSNPDAFIARRNLTAYQKTSEKDLRYVISLSPDVLPELDRIDDAGARNAARLIALSYYGDNGPAAYDWSLGWLHTDSIQASD